MTQEQVVLVWACTERVDSSAEQYVMNELAGLVESAGGEVTARFVQNRPSVDSKWIVGEGKLAEIKQFLLENSADLVIFHNTLSGSQQRNIENFLGVRVIDRTRVILDVFALRARSLEGKLQVELAQLLYMMPRLTGKGLEMSRLGGGIGTRGPGETKLETDRRVIKKKISQLQDKLESVSKVRHIHRQGRKRSVSPVLALVGYTSAGKSTLFTRLSGTETEISAKLFSTLDPLIRRVDLGKYLPGCHALISDTVGFIRDMPKEVKSAFKATLEEITEADVILMVLDISHPDHLQHRRAVEEILDEIKTTDQTIWTVYNKIDLLKETIDVPRDGFWISAKHGQGIDELLDAFFKYWTAGKKRYLLKLGKVQQKQAEKLDEWAMILRKWYEMDCFCVDLVTTPELIAPFLQKTGSMYEELPLKNGTMEQTE